MKNIILGFIISLLFALPAAAEVEASLNGSIIDVAGKTNKVIAGSIDYENEGNKWKQNLGAEVLYQDSGNTPLYNVELSGKLGHNIDAKNYIKAGLRFEYDNSRKNTMALTSVIGHGYRIIRNDKMRLSNELGIGVRGDQSKTVPIMSDSIWFSWKVTPTITIGNKFLVEKSIGGESIKGASYINNIATASYDLNSHLSVHIENRFYHETYDNKTTLLGITAKF